MKNTIILFLCIILLFTSCSFDANNMDKKNKDDIIELWWYDYGDKSYHNLATEAIQAMNSYAQKNEIKLNISKFSEKEMSYSDYIFKRNIAVETGEVDVIIDNSNKLYQIRNKCADYSKLSTYENILKNYRNKYCLPICIYAGAAVLNGNSIKPYGIKSNDVITMKEYYELKQKMKEKGANFNLNGREFFELIDYYMIKNNVNIMENEGEYSINKENAQNAIKEICEDINIYYDLYDVSYHNFIINLNVLNN